MVAKHIVLNLLLSLPWLQVASGQQTEAQDSPSQISCYLDSVFTILHENALHRAAINWDTIRAVLRRETTQAKVTLECYPAIRQVLRLLNDHHSFLLTPAQRARLDTARYMSQVQPQSRKFKGKIGLVTIPSFASSDTMEQKLYASDVKGHLARLRASGIKRWVVDLRSNLGGNMWPMLEGLSSLLAADTVGFFAKPDGRKDA